MKLIDVLREECIVAGASFSDKADALREIVQVAKRSPILKDASEDEMLSGLLERESLGSTGFGKGIAIPHCRLKSATDFVVGIITAPSGVNFESLDTEPVNLIVFIIAPEADPNAHLKLLSAISHTLLIPGVIQEILTGNTPGAIRESFLRHTFADIETKKPSTKSLFNVFIRDENVFRDILEKLTGFEGISLMVANTENVAACLAKVPLFAEFWRDEPHQFGKVIIGVIQKGLSNEVVRRIESVTGDLNECTGVMITIQNLSYAVGSV